MTAITLPRSYRSRMSTCANPACPKPDGRYLKVSPNQSYCSDECHRVHRFGRRICPECGAEFTPDRPGRTWCSLACFRQAAN